MNGLDYKAKKNTHVCVEMVNIREAWKVKVERMVSSQLVIHLGKNKTESSYCKQKSIPGWIKSEKEKQKLSPFISKCYDLKLWK
jgi:hypothetical protein